MHIDQWSMTEKLPRKNPNGIIKQLLFQFQESKKHFNKNNITTIRKWFNLLFIKPYVQMQGTTASNLLLSRRLDAVFLNIQYPTPTSAYPLSPRSICFP
mgnify:CR=1 FL=1